MNDENQLNIVNPSDQDYAPVVLDENAPMNNTPPPVEDVRPKTKKIMLAALPFVLVMLALLGFLSWGLSRPVSPETVQTTGEVYEIDLPDDLQLGDSSVEQAKELTVNGRLTANGSVVFRSTSPPSNPEVGEIYYDTSLNVLRYYNGSVFVELEQSSLPQDLTVNSSPTFNDISISGVIPVPNGGTGLSSLLANGLLYGNGTNNVEVTNAPSAGQILVGSSAGQPIFRTVKGDIALNSSGFASLSANSVGSSEIKANSVGASELIATGIAAGIYGSASETVQVTVDADGRITSITEHALGFGSGDVLHNGNSLGEDLTIGTNDAYGLNLETSGTTWLNVDTAGVSTFNGAIRQDITTAPTHIGNIADDGSTVLNGARDITVVGDYAYVSAFTDDGLQILDVSDPTSPVALGSVVDDLTTVLNGTIYHKIVGNYAYVASFGDNGLQIVDISDPMNPVALGSIADDISTVLDNAYGIDVVGKYAYIVATGDNGLGIVDISDPNNPTYVGGITDTGATSLESPRTVQVVGKYAYVTAANGAALQILDISDPTNITAVGRIIDDATTELDGAQDVQVVGKYAYIAAYDDNGFEIVDVSDPANPTHVAAVADTGATELNRAYNLEIVGNYAFVTGASDNGVEVLDISDPTAPTHVSAITDNATTLLNGARGIDVAGNLIYIGTGNSEHGVQILEIGGGAEFTSAEIGTLSVNNIKINQNIYVTQNSYFQNGVNIGAGGLNVDGDVAINGSTTLQGTTTYSGVATDITTGTDEDLTVTANGTGQIILNDTVQVATLAAADTDTLLCRNSSNQIATCNSSFTATDLQDAYQNGNTITATDAEGDIDLTVSEATNFSVDITGTGSFLVQNGGTNILEVNDTGTVEIDTSVTNTVLTGSINPINSTTVTGVGTLFTTELEVGDVILVSGEYRRVLVITNDTTISVGQAFSDNPNDTSPEKVPNSFIYRDSGGAITQALSEIGQTLIDYSSSTTADNNSLSTIFVSDSGNVSSGTDNNIGQHIHVSRTGATGGNINSIGQYVTVGGDTGGTSQAIGVQTVVFGADTNIGLYGGGLAFLSSSITELTGVYGTIQSLFFNGTVAEANGLKAYLTAAGGTFTEGAGLRVESAGGGTINTNYGIIVEAQTAGTTNYGIRVADSTAGAGTNYGLVVGDAKNHTLWVNDSNDSTDEAGGIVFGSSRDTNLYRSADNTLRTDDSFSTGGTVSLVTQDQAIDTFLTFEDQVSIGTGATLTVSNDSMLRGIVFNPTIVYDQPFVLTGGRSIEESPILTNPTGVAKTMPHQTGFYASATIQGDGALFTTSRTAFLDPGNYTTINGGSVSATNHVGFGSELAVGSGANVVDRRGIDILNATGTGTVTDQYGIFVRPLTKGANDYGIRVDAADTQTLWLSGNAESTTASAGIAFGSSRDTNLYRSADDTLRTDDTFSVGGTLQVSGSGISNISPNNPTHVAAITDDGTTQLDAAQGMDVQGEYAYIAGRTDNGVEIIDISDPNNPTHAGAITDDITTLLDGAFAIDVVGDYAYVASVDEDGLEILDVSDPSNPTHVGSLADDGTTELDGARGVQIVGKYAYVVAGADDGVSIIDISDPANPSHVGAITDDGTTELDAASDITVVGNYAYVTARTDDGVEILDISDPTTPTHVGAITDDLTTELDGASMLQVRGKYAYVTAYDDDGFEILDISDPTAPTHVAAINDDGTTALDGATGIDLAGNYAFVSAASSPFGVEVIDISDPTAPTHIGAIFDDGTTELDQTSDVIVVGNYAYATGNNDDGFEVLNIGGISTHAANIGSLEVTNVYVEQKLVVSQSSNFNGGVTVGVGGLVVQGLSVFNEAVQLQSLGTADTDTLLCRNSSNQIATCSSTFDSSVTLQDAYQNGNTILATDAEGDIDLTVSEATNFSVDITGTGSFLVQDSGTTVLEVADGTSTVDVTGTLNVTTDLSSIYGEISVGISCGGNTCIMMRAPHATPGSGLRSDIRRESGGLGFYVGTTSGAPTEAFYISNGLASVGIGDTGPDAHLEVSANGTTGGNIFLLSSDDGNDGNILTVTEAGSSTFTTLTDSLTGFRVMDADGGNPVLNVDTINERVGLGTATPTEALDVVGNGVFSNKLQVGSSAGAGTISQCGSIIGVYGCEVGFEVYNDSTETISDSIGSQTLQVVISGAANSAGQNLGSQNILALGGTQNYTGSLNAGLRGAAVSATSGTITSLQGVVGNVNVVGGTTTTAAALQAQVIRSGGTITNGIGLLVQSASGAITTNYGVQIQAQTSGTTNYGLRLDDSTAGAGTNYGLVIGDAKNNAVWINDTNNSTDEAGGIVFGSSRDTNLYRSAADTLRTDDSLVVAGNASRFQSTSDSVTALQVLDSDGGTPILNVDTTNERVGIGVAAPASALHVVGDELRVGDGGSVDLATGDGDLYVEDQLEVDGNASVAGAATIGSAFITARFNLGAQSYSVPDSGDGSPAAGTLTPTSSYVEVTCSDADGCDITMGEGSASEGDTLFIVNISANVANFADTSGVSEISGAFAAAQYDTITMVYIGDRWVEVSRSDN